MGYPGIVNNGDFTEARFGVGYPGNASAIRSRRFLFGSCTSSRKRTILIFRIILGRARCYTHLCTESRHRSYFALSKVAGALDVREVH